jgi:hemerythrin-like domain-containing protein
MMEDCHRRIEHFLEVVDRVLKSATGNDRISDQTADALTRALTYFERSAPKHTADEEVSLFPRMRALNQGAEQLNEQLAAALARLDELEHDHAEAERLHAVIDEGGRAWLATGFLDSDTHARMSQAIELLQATYARHIAIEDREVFPAARRLLDAQDLEVVGTEMRERRRDGATNTA